MITRPCDDRAAALALLRRHRITTGRQHFYASPGLPPWTRRHGVLVKHHPDLPLLVISHTAGADVREAVLLLRSRGFNVTHRFESSRFVEVEAG